MLSGILENCDASVKAEVGPTFRVFNQCCGTVLFITVPVPALTSYGSGSGSDSETLFLTPLSLSTEEATRGKGCIIYTVYRRLFY